MEKYKNESTERSPLIDFDLIKGSLLIKGRSIAEDALEFYKPLLSALDLYSTSVKPLTLVTIELEYFNTPSAISILEIFKKLESIQKQGTNVIINWKYEEEDIMESGEDYQTLVDLPFRMIQM